MSDIRLTPEEIRDITGKTQPAAQLRHVVLRKVGELPDMTTAVRSAA